MNKGLGDDQRRDHGLPDQEDPGEESSNLKSVEQFASRFIEQVRRGKQPSSVHLEEQFPELSGDVDGLAKTLSVLEEASFRRRVEHPRGSVIDAAGRRQQMLGGFRLIREISRGGMGIVYEAEQESLARRVAVKVLPPSPLLTDVARSRFEREGTAVARLHHSNIVPVFGTGVEQGVQYCVMQYIDGHSLDQLIAGLRNHFGYAKPSQDVDADSQNRDTDNARFAANLLLNRNPSETGDKAGDEVEAEQPARSTPKATGTPNFPQSYWRNVARIGADVADALSHAHHQGVLHRDIKPGNLLLDHNRDIWVTDFGLAKLQDKGNLTGSGNLIGTLRYTSPEQFGGKTDARSDVYALGLTLYELCTLEPAFPATDRRELMREVMTEIPVRPRLLNPKTPRDLETIISKAMAQESANRYQNAADLSSDLKNFLNDRAIMARRQTPWELGWRWCRRHRLETALGGLAAAMLLLFSITASLAYVREANLRRDSDATAQEARQALDRLYDSYLPDWSTSSTVSAHGSIDVSPASARMFEELVEIYSAMARPSDRGTEKTAVLESSAALRRVGLIYHRLGQFRKSKRSYTQAKDRLTRYYVSDRSPDIQLERAKVFNELGAVSWTQRHVTEAYRSHQDALELLGEIQLEAASESERAVRFEVARTLYLLGRRGRGFAGGVLKRPDVGAGDQNQPLASRRETIDLAAKILGELMDLDPATKEYLHLLALCYREQSDGLLSDDGQPIDKSITQAIDGLEYLVGSVPEHPGYRYALCTTLQWVRVQEGQADAAVDAAAARYRRSLEIAEQLSRERPDEWIYAASEVQGHLQLSVVLHKGQRFEKALVSANHAIDAGKALANKYPDCDTFDFWVGFAQLRKASHLRNLERHELALQAYQGALDDLVVLPDMRLDTEWKRVIYRNLYRGWIGKEKTLEQLGRHKEAKAARREVARYLKLAEQHST